MSKTFRPWDVDQVWLLPPSIQDLVPSGHVAHFVRDTVRTGLDLSAIIDSYDEEHGYPPYHPGMMVALLLYAYSQGIYSADRSGLRGATGFCGSNGDAASGFPHDQRVSQTPSGGAIGPVPADLEAVPRGRPCEAWPCGARRHQDQGQCRDQQGDELWPDERGRAEACRGSPTLVRRSRPNRQGRGPSVRSLQAWRRDAGLDGQQREAAREDPYRQGRAGSRSQGCRPKLPRSRTTTAPATAARAGRDASPSPSRQSRATRRNATSPIPTTA